MFLHGIRARFDGDGGQVCCWEVHLVAGVKKGRESSDLLQEAVDLKELVVVLEGEYGGERQQPTAGSGLGETDGVPHCQEGGWC